LKAMKEYSSHRIVILAFNGVTLVDIVSLADVFHIASTEIPSKSYDVIVASEQGGLITASSGLQLGTQTLSELDPASIGTLIVVPGGGPATDPPIPTFLANWVRRHSEHFDRICSVCTGAFILAAAGLTENKKITTHWESTQELKRKFPQIDVQADSVFVKDGKIWTSAGFSAGIDVALGLVEDDFGYTTAISVAKKLIVFMKRPEGQPQLSAALSSQSSSGRSPFLSRARHPSRQGGSCP
jgi:transcriptional regulator GlxA family with amidase domain